MRPSNSQKRILSVANALRPPSRHGCAPYVVRRANLVRVTQTMMQRMRTLRALVPSNPGSRYRPCTACGIVLQQKVGKVGTGSYDAREADPGTRSLSSSSWYDRDIPKRIYQGAPKRQHGKNAGMRKWSEPSPVRRKAEDKAVDVPGEAGTGPGEMLAFGRTDSDAARFEPREVSTKLQEIRVSPWSLNLLARLVRGLDVVDATAQLTFCKKKHTTTILKAIQNALNLADMRYGLTAEQMRVGEIFVTKGKVQKSMRIMGRGRAGIQRRKWSHLNLTLREIDFDALIEAAETKSRSEKLKARKKEVGAIVAARRQEELGVAGSTTASSPLQLDSK